MNSLTNYVQFTEALPESPFTEAGLGITIELETGVIQCSARGWKQLGEWATAYSMPLLKWQGTEFEAQQLVAQFCLEQALINWVPRLRGYTDESWEEETEILPLPSWDWTPYVERFKLEGELCCCKLDRTITRRTGYALIQPEAGPFNMTHLCAGTTLLDFRLVGLNPWLARTVSEQCADRHAIGLVKNDGKSAADVFESALTALTHTTSVVSFELVTNIRATCSDMRQKESPPKR